MISIKYSIIIPHRNSVNLLNKLLATIPNEDCIEVIVVDNSPIKISREEIITDHFNLKLIYSAPNRGAGGARNEGIKESSGEWLIFADADDYFSENTFETFQRYYDSCFDIIYFCAQGKYIDTGEYSNRGEYYANLVANYQEGKNEIPLRIGFSVPWAKMLRSEYIKINSFKFDEVIASNDEYFSLLTGYNAKNIAVDQTVVYIVTVSKGSLTKRINRDVILSRYNVTLRINRYLKDHGLKNYQRSIMYYFKVGIKFGFKTFFCMIANAIKYRQNPFIGISRWLATYKMDKKQTGKEAKYLTS